MEPILADARGQDINKLTPQKKRLLYSRLLARLVHELRNPLGSLDIRVQILAYFDRLLLRAEKRHIPRGNGLCNQCHPRLPGGDLAGDLPIPMTGWPAQAAPEP